MKPLLVVLALLLDPIARCDDLNDHELRIEPELGPDPHWVCERAGISVSRLGQLT